VKPRIVIKVGGGLIQEIICDQETRILCIDEDAQEEPDSGNNVVTIDGRNYNAWIYPPDKISTREVDAEFSTIGHAILVKEGLR